jgi:uncharacterized membrane protein
VMPQRMRVGALHGDDGSTLILTVFYGFLALVLILVVVAASSLYLERKRLFTLADGAALAGAEAFPLESVVLGGAGTSGAGAGGTEAGGTEADGTEAGGPAIGGSSSPGGTGLGAARPELTPADVAAAVGEYLAAAQHGEFEGLTVTRATSVDGQSATVSLSARWRPPVLTLVVPQGVSLEVTAVARSVFW